MNILLWALQILLALHTLMGAVWKFSHSPEQSMASLKAIPPGLWSAMAILELLCCLALLAPALRRSLARLGAPAAAFILAEMLLFAGVHLRSGSAESGPLVYWAVVAAVCAVIAYGRRRPTSASTGAPVDSVTQARAA